MVHSLWKTVWKFINKLNAELSFDPAVRLLGIYPKGLKTDIQTNTYKWKFIAAQFTITKRWKEQRNKIYYSYIIENYSVIKRNKALIIYAIICMNYENIMVS